MTQATAANIDLIAEPGGTSGPVQVRALDGLPSRRPDAVLLAEVSRPLLLPQLRRIAAAGIPLIGEDFIIDGLPAMVATRRDDDALTRTVLTQMSTDLGTGATVALIAPSAGRPSLDRRVAAWTAVRDANRWRQVLVDDALASHLGDSPGTNAGNPSLIAAALRVHPDIQGIFAVNAQLATDTVNAVTMAGLTTSVKVYAVVDDDLDPTHLSVQGSPWVAVAMVDPAQLAALSIRAAALRLAGQLPGENLVLAVPGPLVTQSFLRQHAVDGPGALYPLLPTITNPAMSSPATTSWLPDAVAAEMA